MNTGTIIIYTSIVMAFAMAFSLFYRKKDLLEIFKNLYTISSSLIFVSAILLLFNLVTDNFSYAYIYNNSSSEMNVLYKISAFWAGSEGSFLLWLLLIKISGLTYIRTNRNSLDKIILAVVTSVELALLLLLVVKNPFIHIWDQLPGSFAKGTVPSNGTGMNTLLMDPWMISHPPVLFIGYATSVIVFAKAISALVNREYMAWVKPVIPWLLTSIVTLGMGIFMGGYWAYKVLGWGGFWGWDPVENSSLVPWIISVVLLHGLLLQRRKGALVKFNLFMAVSYFLFIFYSTFLTKSGILSDFSVHSFGKTNIASLLGVILLVLVALSAFLLFKGLRRDLKSEKLDDRILSYDSTILYGVIVLSIYGLVIIAGTSWPIISSFTGNPVAVTEKFYNNLSIPFGILLLVSLILSEYSINRTGKKLIILSFCLGIITTGLVALSVRFEPFMAIFIFLCLFYISMTSAGLKRRKQLPKNLSHLGISLFIVGVIFSSYLSWTEQVEIRKGENASVANISITLKDFKESEESYIEIDFIKDGNGTIAQMPYFIESKGNSLYREPFISSSVIGDYYVIPQQYNFSELSYSTGILNEGHAHSISGHSVKLLKLKTGKMGKEGVSITADLLINKKRYSPSLSFVKGKRKNRDARITSTGQTVSLRGINARDRSVEVYISPLKGVVIPPDSAVFTVTFKPLIWLVWAGTILITLGLALSLLRQRGKSDSEKSA